MSTSSGGGGAGASSEGGTGVGGSTSSGGSGAVQVGQGGTSSGSTDAGASSGGGTGGVSGGVASGDADAGMSPAKKPVILSFSATPPNLPAGGGAVTLAWKVTGAASLSIDSGVGKVTGNSVSVNITATTVFTLTATNTEGTVTATTAAGIGQNPSTDGDRYVAMVAPTGSESFIAPATLRLVAAAHDPNVYTNVPTDGLGGNASDVQFYVDDQMVLEVDGAHAEYWMFKGFVEGIATGQHRVWARAIYVSPTEVLDSVPMVIDVIDPPAYDQTKTLDQDVVLSGGQGYELIGTADKRIRLNGNGHEIVSQDGATGNLTLQFVDVFGLGDATDTTQSSIDVTTTGAVAIEDSTFDTSNTLTFSLGQAATASVQRNLFRSNMRMPIGQAPDGSGTSPSYPALSFTGASTQAKVFAGNNVGAGWVEFLNTQAWTVGGTTDADSNVLIGPRVGIHVEQSSGIEVERNYSHHVYYGGWSQGNDFELFSSPSITVEHNVIYGSSWPARGVGCEFRYNLILEAGHEWLWVEPNASIHHNVFVGGDNDVGGIYVLYSPTNVKLFNNTFDGLSDQNEVMAVKLTNGDLSLMSNAFVNFPNAPTVSIEGGTLTADYNLFHDTQTTDYSDGRKPAHDVSGEDPLFANPPKQVFDIDEGGIWTRATTTADVLSQYRARYTPGTGSPLIDQGDPGGGTGNDIGAVGAGTPSTLDRFGRP
ncbi:MAG TPA: right-handed parallel beta-helix repeat-containing protein [Polyangiaceae bacterium]|nr:right-handed parallel beta-helix repeat-containing protein [Polyangiaceae bacterium]